MGPRVFIVIAMMAMVSVDAAGFRSYTLTVRKVHFVIVAVLSVTAAILDKRPIRYFSGFD